MSDQCIVRACESSWEGKFISGIANKNNCSGLVKAVAKELNIAIPNGQADTIVEYLDEHDSWEELASGEAAKIKAETGHFVIAGLKSSNHSPSRASGHVVIVVGGTMYHNKYPKCWSGSTGGAQSNGNKSVGEVWNRTDRDNVHYYCYTVRIMCP